VKNSKDLIERVDGDISESRAVCAPLSLEIANRSDIVFDALSLSRMQRILIFASIIGSIAEGEDEMRYACIAAMMFQKKFESFEEEKERKEN